MEKKREIKKAKSTRKQEGKKLDDIIHYKRTIRRNRNIDKMIARNIESEFKLTEGYIEELQDSNVLSEAQQKKAKSSIERAARYFKMNSKQRKINYVDIELFEEHLENLMTQLKNLNCANNKKVKLEIETMERKIRQTVAQMKEITQKNTNPDVVTTLILGKVSELSSVLEPNKKTLGNEFSFLKGAIEEAYNQKDKRNTAIRIGAGALAGATILGGASVGIYSTIQDQKAEEVINGLKSIYGSKLSEDIKNEYIDENGRVKPGAYEIVKRLTLNKFVQSKINNSLKEKGAEAYTEDVTISFGKGEDWNKKTHFVRVSGVIKNKTEDAAFSYEDECITYFDDGLSEEFGNKKVKEYYRNLDNSSINDIIKEKAKVKGTLSEIADEASVGALVAINNKVNDREYEEEER